MKTIAIIGGGAAGMMAAITAARLGNKVVLFEHNEKLGKKIFITGKGRCNVTNQCDTQKMLENVVTNSKFLYSACYGFDNESCMDFFEELGVRLKVERGNRVFPASDHSSDIIRALEFEMRRLGVTVHLNSHVNEILTKTIENKTESIIDSKNSDLAISKSIDESLKLDKYQNKTKKKLKQDKKVVGLILKNGHKVEADAVILATGGVSYVLTGSDGSGFELVKKLGHEITPLFPALVPLCAKENWCRDLMGLSLKNVQVTIFKEKKVLYQDFGEMLFTHYGVSGPLILSASSLVTKQLNTQDLKLEIDLKPALTDEQLDKRLIRDFEKMQKKQLKNALVELLPSRLIPIVIMQAHLDEEKAVNLITKEERMRLKYALKHLTLSIYKTADFNEAIITQGGVIIKEINPSTMESKIVSGLYFAGECMDVDAFTGGFNLQIAWSSGYLAGQSASEEIH